MLHSNACAGSQEVLFLWTMLYEHVNETIKIVICLLAYFIKAIAHFRQWYMVIISLHFRPTYPTTSCELLQYCNMSKTRQSQHITPVLHSLHWLPINQRIIFKLLVLVFNAINCTSPTYQPSILTPVTQVWQIKSPCCATDKAGNPGRSCLLSLGPRLWNQLPGTIRASD